MAKPAARLTCAETPLDWPESSELTDLINCNTCGIHLSSEQPGAMKLLTRRQGGGVGDGISIDLGNAGITADYRGTRYFYDQSIIHIPGVHIFPGQKDVFPAEVHIHLVSVTQPTSHVTVCIPADHRLAGKGAEFFTALTSKPDPTIRMPRLESILPVGADILQYRGPTIIGRTRDTPTPDTCSSTVEHMFLLVLTPVQINAADMERIQREGSLSTDYRDLPAPGIPHDNKTKVDATRLKSVATVAHPGLLGPVDAPSNGLGASASGKELECKPVKVVGGRDVIDENGKTLDIYTLLGISGEDVSGSAVDKQSMTVVIGVIVFFGVLIGIIIADAFFGLLWIVFFHSGEYATWEPLKIWFFLLIAFICGCIATIIPGIFGG